MNLRFPQVAQCVENAARFKPFGKLLDFCGNYYSPYYAFMMLAMSRIYDSDKLAVELGCDQGRGLVALAMSGGTVIGIDHTRKVGMNKAQEICPNIIFLEQDSLPIPEPFTTLGRKIDVLHIDTEHSYAQASEEFRHYKPFLNSPSLVIFDDLHAQDDSVLKFFMELPYVKIQDDRMHPECGWGVIYYVE
jgi:hypothetical protein